MVELLGQVGARLRAARKARGWTLEHGATAAERERIHAAIRDAIVAAPLDWFTGKLRVVLDGIERTLAPAR